MRKLSFVLSCSAWIAVAACGSSSSTNVDAAPPPAVDAAVPAVDAAPTIDAAAPPAGVATEVPCANAPTAPTISTPGFAYTPATTNIAAGSVVKFTLSSDHDVASTTTGLRVDFGATKCLKFATAGTYTFHCTPHGFVGTITVTAVGD
jgi:plastocyanin